MRASSLAVWRTTHLRVALVALACAIAIPSSPLVAQRIAPSGVQHRAEAPITVYTDSAQRRSHVDGAVRGGMIGFGAGAVVGAAYFGVLYAALLDGRLSASNAEALMGLVLCGAAGGLAGATVGAIIGGIIGR